MAESLLLPVVRGVLSKASSEIIKSVTGICCVDRDCHKLERQLLGVQSLLADAEVKSETNPAVKAWMKELKAAAYQADDALDDFQYEALRREAHANESTARKVLRYFTLYNPLIFRLAASWNLRKVLKKIDELVMEMHTFGLVVRAEAPQALFRETHSALDESVEMFGRDDDKDVVVRLLLGQQDQKNVQVLPIIGMGGLGKTTLAKMVFNDSKVQKNFELKMWHCVSENFEVTDVLRSIIQLATNETCDLPDTIELLRGRLQEVIGHKRFLLVLDDMWNEEQHKWDNLKPLLCSSSGGTGSMIVVTSRSRQVASIMGTFPPHELSCLTEDDSWKLFSKKAFSKGVHEQPELVMIGKRIVNKCNGLPLALKAMGGLMSSKPRVQQWEDIAKSNLGEARDEVLPILKLSYRQLSSEMKQCFAFCAVFPKDYVMEKDVLTQLWLANGFLHEEGTMKSLLAEKAEFIFNELAWRSFLEDVKERRFFHSTMYKAVGCKMHDLVHDLAKDVTDECAFAAELVQKKASIKDVHHMQVSSNELADISGLLKGTLSFRTLLSQSKHTDLKELKLMSLRALQCGDPSIIDSQLINAAHLRYLDLSNSGIVRMPDSLCVLYNLQSLRLNGCRRLQYLPEGMVALRNLEHLYLFGCESLQRMPPKLSLLHNLRTLTTFIVDTEDGCGIEELKGLGQLGNRLELYNLGKVKTGSQVNIHEKQNLSELLLHWGRNLSGNLASEDVSNAEQVLESLAPHARLQILEVHRYRGPTISQWMRDPGMFQCIKKLCVSTCPRCKELPIVWLSSSLEELFLSDMNSLATLCAGLNSHLEIFPKLNIMELLSLPELERWAENSAGEPIMSVVFPLLKKLTITDCPKLASLPECPVLTLLCCTSWSKVFDRVSMPVAAPVSMPLDFCPSLVHLEVGVLADVVMPLENQQNHSQRPLGTLQSLKTKHDDGFASIFKQSKFQLRLEDCFPILERLEFESCSSIVHWPVKELRCLPSLRSLYLLRCSKLEGKGSSSEETLPLPLLEKLQIASCDSLLEIPMLPTSLEEMGIQLCGNLVALPSNLGNLGNLREFHLFHCDGLKALPNGIERLTSLEQLTIRECPGIEKFPHGLLRRLPTLNYLKIEGCPDLQRCCREGGEYFDLISTIPEKIILSAEAEQMKPVGAQWSVCFSNPYSQLR